MNDNESSECTFRWLEWMLRRSAWLRDRLDAASPGAFRAGVLLHTGQTHIKLADRLYVAPIDTLWSR